MGIVSSFIRLINPLPNDIIINEVNNTLALVHCVIALQHLLVVSIMGLAKPKIIINIKPTSFYYTHIKTFSPLSKLVIV